MSSDDKREEQQRGGQHRDREQERRDTDGHRRVDPDTVREPEPGKRGR